MINRYVSIVFQGAGKEVRSINPQKFILKIILCMQIGAGGGFQLLILIYNDLLLYIISIHVYSIHLHKSVSSPHNA